jgi:hypothetical protein
LSPSFTTKAPLVFDPVSKARRLPLPAAGDEDASELFREPTAALLGAEILSAVVAGPISITEDDPGGTKRFVGRTIVCWLVLATANARTTTNVGKTSIITCLTRYL